MNKEIYYKLFILLLLFSFSINNGFSQIMGNGHTSIQLTEYPSGKQDSIFVFCATTTNEGSLTATPVASGPLDFTWNRYNTATNAFDIFVLNDPGVSTSTANNLITGGYRVFVSNGEEYTAWVFNNTLEINTIDVDTSTCDLILDGDTSSVMFTYYYYNDAGQSINLTNELSVDWITSPSMPTNNFLHFESASPSVETTFTLQVTDDVGCSDEYDVVISPKSPGTDFEYTTDKDGEEDQDAPLEVSFTNTSLNSASLEWSVYLDTLIETSTFENPVITLTKPGTYTIELCAISPQGCPDEFPEDFCVEQTIVVDSVLIEIPNFFSPTGANPVFKIHDVSIKDIDVTIFTRWGRKVHEYSGEMANWEGWDGKINDTDRDAQPGIYYYVMRFYGWDDVSYKGKQYTGFVYLLGGK